MKALHFEKALITANEQRIKAGGVTNRIKISAELTPAVATAMEARWLLFDKETVAKHGFKKIELDYEMQNLTFTLDVAGIPNGKLVLTSEKAEQFSAIRKGDGVKKPKKLICQFRVVHTGSPFELLEWMLRTAGAIGTLSLEPTQQEMFADEKPATKTVAMKANGKAKKDAGKSPRTKHGPMATEPSAYPIPTDPNTPEWRTAEEVQAGVPHHIVAADSVPREVRH